MDHHSTRTLTRDGFEEVGFGDALVEAQQHDAEAALESREDELNTIDLYYRQERARLNAILAEEKVGSLAWEEARRRLANLDATQANDRQAVLNRTRGPMEEFSAQFGDITDELEELKVRGIMGAVDALTALTGGFDDVDGPARSGPFRFTGRTAVPMYRADRGPPARTIRTIIRHAYRNRESHRRDQAGNRPAEEASLTGTRR